MKTLYIDCSMGAAGDMITSALLELTDDPGKMIDEINGAGIPGVEVSLEPSVKCGINGSRFRVLVEGTEEDEHLHDHHHHDHHHHHHHHGMKDIEEVISSLHIPEEVKDDVRAVYMHIAEAESKAHGMAVTDIHFHEVGTMDAVADITAASLLIHHLAPDNIIASPVKTGKGTVSCAHGVLPVPAPATSSILEGIPSYSGDIDSELCTPTGAALLKHFVSSFEDMPVMKIERTGYGMGTKDFKVANYLRAFIGTAEDRGERVTELSCNIDDMTAEDIGFAIGALMERGALEAFTTPCVMKKSRPGMLLTVLCTADRKDETVRDIFTLTSTIGIREKEVKRYVLERSSEERDTDLGRVRIKTSRGYGVERAKAEYDDIAFIAERLGLSPAEVRKKLGV